MVRSFDDFLEQTPIFFHNSLFHLASCFIIAEEMDWDKNGMVNFKEFLFAFTRWVGIDDIEDEEEEGEEKV